MNIQSVKLVCFSPTGTTRSIVRAIANGLGVASMEVVDITKSEVRSEPLKVSADELLVVAVPVYVGRVPAILNEWMQAMEATGAPTVCVVVYGNREYEDALLELKTHMAEKGAFTVGCAAFIGEHSFSSDETPIAVSRPDAADLGLAEDLGRQLNGKLKQLATWDGLADIQVPGDFPYRAQDPRGAVDFIAVNDLCTECGVCAKACPVDAIDMEKAALIDMEKCILCCACIKACPENAKSMKSGMIKDIAIRLSGACKDRKEPVIFL